jgi:hypothetical protein
MTSGGWVLLITAGALALPVVLWLVARGALWAGAQPQVVVWLNRLSWLGGFGAWARAHPARFAAIQAALYGVIGILYWLGGRRGLSLVFFVLAVLHSWAARSFEGAIESRANAGMAWLLGPMAEGWDDPIEVGTTADISVTPAEAPAAPTPKSAGAPWQDPGRPLSATELRRRARAQSFEAPE